MFAALRAAWCSTLSSESPTHGEQEVSFWNGHYDCTGYYLLFLFNPSEPVKDWSLMILKEKPIKIGAKIVSYGQTADAHPFASDHLKNCALTPREVLRPDR